MEVGNGDASPTGAEVLVWNYSGDTISVDPDKYEITVYSLWNWHTIEVEKPQGSGQTVTIGPGEHALLTVDWSDTYGILPKSRYSVSFDFHIDDIVETRGAAFSIY